MKPGYMVLHNGFLLIALCTTSLQVLSKYEQIRWTVFEVFNLIHVDLVRVRTCLFRFCCDTFQSEVRH